MDKEQFIKDQIDRYIYQISRFLVSKNKQDIEKEIRTLIDDMLETRCQDRDASKEDLEAVFAELGKPSVLAAKYNDSKRYLIGPAIFPVYCSVLKVVLIFVVAATLFSNLISIVTGTFSWENLGSVFSAALGFFAIVTLVFGFVEWKGMSMDEIFDGKIDEIFDGKINLPPVPEKKARIPRAEPIVGLIFLSVFAAIFLFSPQYIGFWDASRNGFVSVFDTAVIRSLIWLFLIGFGISAVKEIAKLLEGRYSVRLMIVTILCNMFSLALILYIFRNFPIWNQDFPGQILAAVRDTDFTVLSTYWNFFTETLFPGVIIFAMVIDTLSCIVKSLVYGLRSKEK